MVLELSLEFHMIKKQKEKTPFSLSAFKYISYFQA